jgi:hypothetical protein
MPNPRDVLEKLPLESLKAFVDRASAGGARGRTTALTSAGSMPSYSVPWKERRPHAD